MAKKKTTKKTDSVTAQARGLVDPVVGYGREVWLAGLGAFSMAQEESGKVFEKGSKLFDQLVEEGSKLEGQTRKVVDDTTGDIRGGIEDRVSQARESAVNNWDKLEKVFEDRVARALNKLGVPTSEEIQKLVDRVDELSQEVRQLNQGGSGAAQGGSSAAKKTAAKKTASKSGTSASA